MKEEVPLRGTAGVVATTTVSPGRSHKAAFVVMACGAVVGAFSISSGRQTSQNQEHLDLVVVNAKHDDKHNSFEEDVINALLNVTVRCENQTFAYCAISSCTRHEDQNVASCACFESTGTTEIGGGDLTTGGTMWALLAVSGSGLIDSMGAYANGTIGYDELKSDACRMFSDGRAYPSMSYDLLSTPAFNFSFTQLEEINHTAPSFDYIEHETCAGNLSLATCGATPCYRNEVAAAHGQSAEPYTCLCPLQPFYARGEELELSAPDIGHSAGPSCRAYHEHGGRCSLNGDGTPVFPIGAWVMNASVGIHAWAKERVVAMSTASRVEDMGSCRAAIKQAVNSSSP